jgi:uncharacterized protein YndB with AHSA1/START domain
MTQQTTVEPVRVAVRVPVEPERAFAAFTAEFAAWWPLASHHIGSQPAAAAIIEPFAGGRWFERAADGTECDWGRVVSWEPPVRLVLTWQIDAAYRYDPELVTCVEVSFTPDGDGTRVELAHRDLERFGERAGEVREVFGSDDGWNGLLRGYAAHAAS